jgi:hypothetical protein
MALGEYADHSAHPRPDERGKRMSRTLAGTTASGVSAAVTLPGYFVQIAFNGGANTVYWSSRGTLTWNAQSWTAYDVQVTGLTTDGGGSALNGTLVVGNHDLAAGALVLLYGVSGVAITVWAYYGDSAPGAGDPVKVFEGVGDNADIPEDGPVRITMQQSGGTTLYCPRTYMTPENGFNWLPTEGQLVVWNGETVRLSAEGF